MNMIILDNIYITCDINSNHKLHIASKILGTDQVICEWTSPSEVRGFGSINMIDDNHFGVVVGYDFAVFEIIDGSWFFPPKMSEAHGYVPGYGLKYGNSGGLCGWIGIGNKRISINDSQMIHVYDNCFCGIDRQGMLTLHKTDANLNTEDKKLDIPIFDREDFNILGIGISGRILVWSSSEEHVHELTMWDINSMTIINRFVANALLNIKVYKNCITANVNTEYKVFDKNLKPLEWKCIPPLSEFKLLNDYYMNNDEYGSMSRMLVPRSVELIDLIKKEFVDKLFVHFPIPLVKMINDYIYLENRDIYESRIQFPFVTSAKPKFFF